MRATEVWVLNYLINSLWQVPLALAMIFVAVRAVRPLGPQEEHRMWCGGLAFATLMPMVTTNVRAIVGEVQTWFLHRQHTGEGVTVAVGDGHIAQALRVSSVWWHVLLWLYALAISFAIVRLGWGVWQTKRLRRQARPLSENGTVAAVWLRYRTSFALQDAEIAVTTEIRGPVTIGVWRRLLLLPESWLNTVAVDDLDAAIAHECAHMQRRDFAKNLLYRVMVLPVSYHPAVWLMQNRVLETREILCDAIAADAVAGRERYARSLLRLAASLLNGSRSHNIHAIGIFDANNFERRVMSLTLKRMDVGKAQRIAIKTLCAALGFATTLSALALRIQIASPQTVSAQQAPAAMPQSFVLAVPRAESGRPAQSFTVEVAPASLAVASPDAVPAPTRVKVTTPTVNPEPAQSSNASMQVAAGVMAGNILSKVTPVYPQEAKHERIQGAVVMNAVIGKDGTIENLEVVSGPKELQGSALEAVKQWVYKPYLLNGNPVEVETTITVTYSLAN